MLVDGARRRSTVLLLSHWPGSDPPARLRRDTSTEMALAHLVAPEPLPAGTGLVAIDHLDEDGLASLYALTSPGPALAQAEQLVGLARAGDFDVVEPGGPREGARAAWALRRLLDPARTPLGELAGVDRPRVDGELLEVLLGRLAVLLGDPRKAAALSAEEEAAFATAASALADGAARIDERPEADLAVVHVADGVPPTAAGALGQGGLRLPVHPAALHALTTAPRVLVVHTGGYVYYDRYETWVALASRTLPARRDLVPLAARLAAAEGAEGAWRATPSSALVAVLASAPGRASRLPPEAVEEALVAHLATAPPAWLPGTPAPALVGGAGRGEGPRRSGGPRVGTTGRARARWRGPRRGGPSA